MSTLPVRDVEDVREFVVEKLDRWLLDATHNDELEVVAATVQNIRHSITEGTMLTREEANWLRELLSEHLDRAMKHFVDYRDPIMNLLEVDSWGIYSDAYYLYCRPGTYTI